MSYITNPEANSLEKEVPEKGRVLEPVKSRVFERFDPIAYASFLRETVADVRYGLLLS